MAVLTIKNNTVTIRGSGRIDLDHNIDPIRLARAVQAAPDHSLALASIYPSLSPSARDAFVEACEADEYLADWFTDIRRHYASVGAPHGRWQVKPVWRCLVRTWLLDEIFLDVEGRTFVRMSHGEILSEREFIDRHGKPVVDHLDEFVEAVGFTTQHIKEVLASPIITKEAAVATPSGEIARRELHGPACVNISGWCLPTGFVLLEHS